MYIIDMLFHMGVLSASRFTELSDTAKPKNVQSTPDTTPMFFSSHFVAVYDGRIEVGILQNFQLENFTQSNKKNY